MRSRSKLLSNNSTFYVDPTNGNDANNGKSPGTAWKTTTKVNAATYNPGATILFLGGSTFSSSFVSLTNTNTPGPITLGSYGSGQATISSGNSNEAVKCVNIPGVTVQNLICTGGGNLVNTTAGINIQNSLGGNTKLQGPSISGCTVSGYGANGINVEGTSGTAGFNSVYIGGNIVHDCTGTSTSTNVTAGIRVSSVPGYGSGISAPSHTNVTITGNTVYNCTGKAGVAKSTGSGITVSQTATATLQYNEAYSSGGSSTSSDGPVGIWAYDATGITIQYNEAHHMQTGSGPDGGGFDLDGGVTNSTLQYNYSHDNAGPGIMIYSYNDGTVTTNSGNVARFNIGQNDGKGLVIGGSTMSGSKAYNNTIFNAANTVFFADTSGYDTVVANNIFYSQSPTAAKVIDVPTPSTIAFTGNDYYGNGTFNYNGTNHSTFSAWQTASGQEKISAVNVGLTSNPSLYVPGGGVNITGYNPTKLMAYNLQSGSAMIGAGVNLSTQYSIDQGATDFYGASLGGVYTPGAAAGDFSSFAATSTESSTFIARTSGFSKLDNVNYDSLITGMVNDGDWSVIDALYMLAAPDSTTLLLNLKSTSYSLVSHGTITVTARTGAAGNGSTGYYDTQFTGNSGSPNFVQNSATIAVYNRTTTAPTTDHALMGNSGSAMYNDISVQTPAGTFVAVNEGGAFNGYNIGQGSGNSAGYLFAQRTAAAVAAGYYNGTVSGTGTTEVSGALTSALSMTLMCINNPTSSFATEQISAAMIGGGTISALRTSRRINSFMIAYGVNVY